MIFKNVKNMILVKNKMNMYKNLLNGMYEATNLKENPRNRDLKNC